MDPITIVGFVAAVVQLIDITSKVVNYLNDLKDAPQDRAKLAREAAGLLVLFTDLRYRLEETKSTDPWFNGLRSLGGEGGPLMEFKSAMEDIANKLAPAPRGMNFMRVLHSTLDKREIVATLSKIERLKSLVGLALQKDQFSLSLAMKEETTAGFQEMKTNRDVLDVLLVKKINEWLAAPLPSSNHNTAMKKRQPNTGEWFIQSKEFAEWKMGPSSFMWLHGIPGCGKTILCSTIIQDVISHYQSEPTIAIAYFYFDFNEIEKQRTEMVIRSLIVQLAAQCPCLPESLRSAHSRSQSQQKQPTIEEMTAILYPLLKLFDNTYILLDALDECKDREDLFKFIEVVTGWNIDTLHVLITSRKENDIARSLDPLVTCQLCIQGAKVDADIRAHILERLSIDPDLKKWPADIRKEIEDALTRGAEGMFRWVACQLDSLRKCIKLDALRKALNALPRTLNDTYERILSNLDEEYEEDALKIFRWLCFSTRPMRLDEMVEVLAISDCRFMPEQRLPEPWDILKICSTLVSVTAAVKRNPTTTELTETQELRLAHFSVKEYLISDRRLEKTTMHRYHITPLSAHFSITKDCLTYLLYFESFTILRAKYDDEFPLIRFAAEYWAWHYRYVTDDADRETVDFLGCNLMESKHSCFINWLRIYQADAPWKKPDLNLETGRILSPLYYMSCLGVTGVVELLLKKGANVNAEGGYHGNALSAASERGHEKVVRLLLDQGANINAECKKNPLSTASSNGYKEVVQLLLEKGANINAEGGLCGRALSAASWAGHKEVVRLLLRNGAKINAEGGAFGNALAAASYHGDEGMVRLLLEEGADVNAHSGCALRKASENCQEAVMRLMLKNKADVHLLFNDSEQSLQGIPVDDHEAVIQLLFKELGRH